MDSPAGRWHPEGGTVGTLEKAVVFAKSPDGAEVVGTEPDDQPDLEVGSERGKR